MQVPVNRNPSACKVITELKQSRLKTLIVGHKCQCWKRQKIEALPKTLFADSAYKHNLFNLPEQRLLGCHAGFPQLLCQTNLSKFKTNRFRFFLLRVPLRFLLSFAVFGLESYSTRNKWAHGRRTSQKGSGIPSKLRKSRIIKCNPIIVPKMFPWLQEQRSWRCVTGCRIRLQKELISCHIPITAKPRNSWHSKSFNYERHTTPVNGRMLVALIFPHETNRQRPHHKCQPRSPSTPKP